jgi:hypothetical protein
MFLWLKFQVLQDHLFTPPLGALKLLGSLLPNGVPPGSEIQAPPATFRRPCARANRLAPGRRPSSRQAGNPSPAPGRGPSAPVQRAPLSVLVECWAPKKGVNTH